MTEEKKTTNRDLLTVYNAIRSTSHAPLVSFKAMAKKGEYIREEKNEKEKVRKK